jgi:hypothetical protein
VEDRGFELDKCSCSKRASLDSIAASRAFSFLSCAISFSSCYGFAGLRLHPLFVLHLALLVAGIPSPVEQLLRRSFPTLEIDAAAPAGPGRSFCQFWRRFR